jgi:hypothetical protein
MAYVPGFRNDVFISYAHGDGEPPVSADGKGWVAHLRDRLHAAIRLRLGFSPNIWMDKRDLDPNVNFDNEIHDQLDSAVLILVASPTYIASDYCEKERKAFFNLRSQAPSIRQGSARTILPTRISYSKWSR